MTYQIVLLDGNNISYRVANIATTTTNWLQEQHLLAASSSSFISCRPKATTNGEEEMSASAPFHHISHRAMATTTSYATLRRWQQRSHFVSHEPIISRLFHIASRDGYSNKQVAAATTFVGSNLLVLHIVSPESNDERRGNERETHRIARWQQRPLMRMYTYRIARWRLRQRVARLRRFQSYRFHIYCVTQWRQQQLLATTND
jgi:hypothetical protein